MKTVRRIATYSILTLALSAFAFGNLGTLNQGTHSQLADTSGQYNEWDVGSTTTPTLIQLADTSGQYNEWDVG